MIKYNIARMKTIAVSEKTFRLLKSLKESGKAPFDKIIYELVISEKQTPQSMFGKLKGKAKPFSDEERKQLWEDKER